MTTGACLCGAVRFSGDPVPGRGIGVCHCGMCRISGGGPMMAIRFTGGVAVQAGEALVWYRSSPDGERGFCSRCGSSLFWRATGLPPERATDWAVNVNTLGDGHGLVIREHIHTADKPDFYDFTDAAPRL
jgi:hypothetical protein